MQDNIVDQGLELMLFGMGTVLTFLTVLVLFITLMSWVLQRYFSVAETPVAQAPRPMSSNLTINDTDLVAAISVAIHRHRSKKSQ